MTRQQPYNQYTGIVAIVYQLHRIWYAMPESRLAIFANIVAVLGILGLAFTGRVSGAVATVGIVIIQGSISAFLYGLARQLQEVEDQYSDDTR